MDDIDRILANIDKEEDVPQQGEEDSAKGDSLDVVEQSLSVPEPAPAQETAEESAAESPETAPPIAPSVEFVPRGTKPWNRREPYVIRIQEERLAVERNYLAQSFYFLEANEDGEKLRETLRREIVAHMRRPESNIADRYREFISRSSSDAVLSIIDRFSVPEALRHLFVYHLGPLTIYKVVRNSFVTERIGSCYRYEPGNRASRFFPDEYIKYLVLHWFDENIQSLDLPFDSIQKYEEIKTIVAQKYQSDLKIFNNRLEQINARAGEGKSVNRVRLFQAKGVEWFGYPAIEVYRRFLGAQIFI